MGVGYELVNVSRKERISFVHIPAAKARELTGVPIAASIVTWYLLTHRGDEIAFVPDTGDEWPFSTGSLDDLNTYIDVTDQVASQLVEQQIYEDHGKAWQDNEEPELVYMRDLRNVWMDGRSRPLPVLPRELR